MDEVVSKPVERSLDDTPVKTKSGQMRAGDDDLNEKLATEIENINESLLKMSLLMNVSSLHV